MKRVPIFDEVFKNKWTHTLDERQNFYKNNKLDVILDRFEIFANNPAAYSCK